MPKALVDSNGVVVNIIEWSADSTYTPPDGLTLVDVGDGCTIGATYSSGVFTPPTPADPPAAPPTGEQFAALQSAVATLTMQVLTGGA